MKSISQSYVTFKIHKKSVEVQITSGRALPSKSGAAVRNSITEFSYKSERRMRLLLEDTADLWQSYAVLTYPGSFPMDGKKVKRDIEAFKRWCLRENVKDIFWGLEFQERGAPHINVLLSSWVDKEQLSFAWYRIVGSGDERHLRAGTQISGIKNRDKVTTYVVGYQYKRQQKDVPEDFKNVGRFWGCTRSSKIEASTYTYQYANNEALTAALRPVVAEYEGKIKEWSQNKEKPYTWTFRGNSFVMWSGSEFIKKLIEGGLSSDESNGTICKESEKVLSRRQDDAHVSEDIQDAVNGRAQRKFVINARPHVQGLQALQKQIMQRKRVRRLSRD